jgi:hypothetical protein
MNPPSKLSNDLKKVTARLFLDSSDPSGFLVSSAAAGLDCLSPVSLMDLRKFNNRLANYIKIEFADDFASLDQKIHFSDHGFSPAHSPLPIVPIDTTLLRSCFLQISSFPSLTFHLSNIFKSAVKNT